MALLTPGRQRQTLLGGAFMYGGREMMQDLVRKSLEVRTKLLVAGNGMIKHYISERHPIVIQLFRLQTALDDSWTIGLFVKWCQMPENNAYLKKFRMYKKVHKETHGEDEVPIWDQADLSLLSKSSMVMS